MVVTGMSPDEVFQEIGEVGLVGRIEQDFRRPADAKPGEGRKGDRPPAVRAFPACFGRQRGGQDRGLSDRKEPRVM